MLLTDGVVIERTVLRSGCDGGGTVCVSTCRIEETVRNDTTEDRRVTITFEAFDGNGQLLCLVFCTGTVELVVPAGGRSDFGQHFLVDCDKIARLEISTLRSEPVA